MPGKIANLFMKTLINSPLHGMMGKNLAVITLKGIKTGKKISTPINVVKRGDTFDVTSLKSRTWWRNLKSGEFVNLRYTGKDLPVRGEVIEDPSLVEKELVGYFERNPALGKYFGVQMGTNGIPDTQDLKRIASERVFIRLIKTTK